MPDNEIGLEAVFENEDFQRGVNNYNSAVSDASRNTASAGSAMSNVWDGLASVGAVALQAVAAAVTVAVTAVAALGAVAFDTTKDFIQYEKNITEVFTLLPNLTSDAKESMSQDLRDFSEEMGVLTDQSVPALYQAISAGVPQDNVFDFLRTAQMAAVGGVTSLETAVDGISSVVNAYGADVLDAAQASDLMFTAVKLGKTDFEQLSKSLFQVIPTAASLGVNFGDVTAALAAMTSQGTPTSVATTQLRQLFVELSKEGTNTSKTFQQLSGKSFSDFIASGGNVADALAILEEGAQKSGKKISDMFGSVEAGNAALALTGKGGETFIANIEAMGESAGATETAFNTMEETSARTIERLQAKWEGMKLDFGERFIPIVDSVLGKIEEFANSPEAAEMFDSILKGADVFATWFEDFLSGVIDEIPNVIAAVQEIPQWFKDNEPVIVGILAALGVAVAAFALTVISSAISAAVALAPILIAMALIGAGAALLYTAWTENWGGIQEHVMALWQTVQPIFQSLIDWLQVNVPIALEYLSDLWSTVLLPAIQEVFSWIVANLIPLWISIVEWLQVNIPAAISALSTFWTGTLLPAIEAVWSWISTNLIPLFQALANLFDAVLSLAIRALAGLWQNVLLPAIRSVGDWISANLLPVFTSLSKTINDDVMPVLRPLAEFLQNVLAKAFEAISKAIQTVIGWIGALTEAFNNVELPDALTPGSPTPFEIGLKGINEQLSRLSKTTLPRVTQELSVLAQVRDVPGANGSSSALAGRMASSTSNVNNYLFGARFNVNNSSGLLDILAGLS